MNRAGLDMIQADSFNQVRGLSVYPLVAEEYREAFKALNQDVFKGKSGTLEFKMLDLKGRPLWLYTHAVPLRNEKGEIVLALAATINITDRRQAEIALRKSEARLQSILRAAPAGIGVVVDRVLVEVNDGICKMTGRSRAELLGKSARVLYPTQEDFEFVGREKYRQIAERGIGTVETRWIRKDGSILNVLLSSKPINPDDLSAGVTFTAIDITDRKQAEEKQQESEAFIKNILNSVDEGFIVIDRNNRILTANKAYCSQVGEPCDSVIGRYCYEVSHKTDRPCYEGGEDCAARHVFETGEPSAAIHKHQDAKGSTLYVETKAFPIRDSTGTVTSVIETVSNITEKRLLEEERIKTQKLEAIGTLAGGIAHDFNNLLQGIFGYISMAKMSLDEKDKSLRMLEDAEKALHLSVNLTSQLLTFSKGGKPVKKLLSLRPVIENSVRFALSGSNIDCRLSIDENLWGVEADEGQIGQVIQNIVLNADQAMPQGGSIKITAKNLQTPKKGLSHPSGEVKYVEISVKDSGVGISGEYLQKIFDPYFTTKDRGSGLGLATSYSIITNHGGLIRVNSKVGKGTTVYVYLPASLAGRAEVSKILPVMTVGRKAKILLMDDEELIRNIAGELFRVLGHEGEFAADGEEAIGKYQRARETGKPFDIVILDLTIRGGMGGRETIERLRACDPDVKAIVSSGYSDDPVLSEHQKYGFRARLTKPYRLEDLRETLNALLSG